MDAFGDQGLDGGVSAWAPDAFAGSSARKALLKHWGVDLDPEHPGPAL